jgi:NAD(P)-dependent dehydrogenase (short-subunit alcohol dehydrogenase family)
VTGGGSGIGPAVVARFIEEGARVGVMERVASRAEELRGDFGDKVFGIPGGTMTDLRGLQSLGNDDRSQFAAPGMADRLRAGNPLRLTLEPVDLAGAYLFLSSRRNARGITGTIVTVDAGGMLRVPRPRA